MSSTSAKKKTSTFSLLHQEMTKVEKSKKPDKPHVKRYKPCYSTSSDSRSGRNRQDDKPSKKDPNIPDRSCGDFYCFLCDSHMNSEDMWMSHVTGKKHLKNLKKGEIDSKYEDLDVESSVSHALKDVKDVVVGLSYIHEIRRREPSSPSFFSCFLCHATLPTVQSVIDHVLSVKHRQNYIKENNPEEHELLQATNLRKGHLEPLVCDIALKMEKKYGRGEIKVKQEKPKKYVPLRRTFATDDGDDDDHGMPFKNLKLDKSEQSVWKSIEKERSQKNRRKDSDEEFSARDSPKRSAPVKRKDSPDQYESYKRSEFNKYSRSEYDDYSRHRNLHNKKRSRSPDYDPRSQRPREQKRDFSRARSPSVEYFPRDRSCRSEMNLLPHEIIKKNEAKHSLAAIQASIERFMSYEPQLTFKIVANVMDHFIIKTQEEREQLSKLIVRGQTILLSKLPQHMQSLIQQKCPNSSISSGAAFKPPVVKPNISFDRPNSETNKHPGPQGQQSDISFMENIMKNYFPSSTSVSQSSSSQQNSMVSYQSAIPSYSSNSYLSNSYQIASAAGSNTSYPSNSFQSTTPAGSNTSYPGNSFQSATPAGRNTSYPSTSSWNASGSLGNYSYGQSSEPPKIPGLTLTENQYPDRQSYSSYQSVYSPTKPGAIQNYNYRY